MRVDRTRHQLSAVFLDRDGVINRKAPEGEYVASWDEFVFLPDALRGLRMLATLEVPVIVATNQRGIALGRYTEAELGAVHARMRAGVTQAGGRIDAIYHCPHDRDVCRCRKPRTGMFEQAGRELGVDLRMSALIGDRASDMEAAARIGALRVLVAGHDEPEPKAEYVASNLLAASRWLAGRVGAA